MIICRWCGAELRDDEDRDLVTILVASEGGTGEHCVESPSNEHDPIGDES